MIAKVADHRAHAGKHGRRGIEHADRHFRRVVALAVLALHAVGVGIAVLRRARGRHRRPLQNPRLIQPCGPLHVDGESRAAVAVAIAMGLIDHFPNRPVERRQRNRRQRLIMAVRVVVWPRNPIERLAYLELPFMLQRLIGLTEGLGQRMRIERSTLKRRDNSPILFREHP